MQNAKHPRILAFAGSSRRDSVNKKLLAIAAEGAREAGAEVTVVDLADFPMPLYDGDLEEREGLPPQAKRLRQIMIEHDGLLIASPEYNSSISGLLKNVIDWLSRPQPGEEALELLPFKNKVACLISASPSYWGGLRGLVTLRSILGNIRVLVLPEQLTLPNAFEAFDDRGQLKDAKKTEQAKHMGALLTEAIAKLHTDQVAFSATAAAAPK
jgi:chromate reductase